MRYTIWFLAFLLLASPALAEPLDLTKARHGAYVGLEFRWGGDSPVQKYLIINGVVPRMDGAPFTAVTGTRIQFNALSDLNPLKWSRRDQILAVAGLGVAWWSVTAEHRHSRKRRSAPATVPPVDESDDDSGEGEGEGEDDGDSDGGDTGEGDDPTPDPTPEPDPDPEPEPDPEPTPDPEPQPDPEPEPQPEPDDDDDSDSDSDDDSDSDSDDRRDHCTDGHGRDGEKNKHC